MECLKQRHVCPPAHRDKLFLRKLIVKQGFLRHFPNFIQAVPFSGARAGSQLSTCIDRSLCSISSGAAVLLGQLTLSLMGQLPGSGHGRMHLKPHWHMKQRLSVPTCLSGLSGCCVIVRSGIICGCAYIYPPLVSLILNPLHSPLSCF